MRRVENLELQCFKIISNVGEAKSLYIEALQQAKKGDFERAKNLVAQGEEAFIEGHKSHMELIQKEASNEGLEITLLLLHAEDQMMSTETVKLLVDELIELYRKEK